MKDYKSFAVNLSKGQAAKIFATCKKGEGVVIKLTKNNLHGEHKLPLTQTQINKIKNAKNGVQLNLSAAQLKYMEKIGGFLPLAALIPLIGAVAGGVGGLAGGISSAVNASRQTAEQVRHNRSIEDITKAELSKSTGSGLVSNVVEKIPLLGNILAPWLQKIGLGRDNLKQCECILRKHGYGLYLGPPRHEGSGLFLGPAS